MKYYLIAGEASGDLHASRLMAALRVEDPEAIFRCFGGDMMQAQGATLIRHYRDLAFMGFIPVLMHLPTIVSGLRQCYNDILYWQPDVVILVDYPGFNLKVARYIKQHSSIPVYYYIAPKLWAWKEFRIKNIRRDVDQLFCILPFEEDFFWGKHHYPIHYVGNPTVDEVAAYQSSSISMENKNGNVIALLPGSRQQEIRSNLGRMIEASAPFAGEYQLLIAAAPGISPSLYEEIIQHHATSLPKGAVSVTHEGSYALLSHAVAALVTSGTATLETALFRVPQVVCYHMKAGWLASLGRRLILKIPFISLVNLIAGKEIVPELVADDMTVSSVRKHLSSILPDGNQRQSQLQGYELVSQRLGEPGAPTRAAAIMLRLLRG